MLTISINHPLRGTPLKGNPLKETLLINNPLRDTPFRKAFFLNLSLLLSFFATLTPVKSHSSFSERVFSDNSEFSPINSTYWLSSDLILSVVVLGWFLFLWRLQKIASASFIGTRSRKIGKRDRKTLRSKFFMFLSPHAETHKIYRHLRF